MTKPLKQAFKIASELPDDLQDQLAQELLEEIGWESRRDHTLAGSQEKLEKLAEKAEREYHAGKTKKWGSTNFEISSHRGFHILLSRASAPNSAACDTEHSRVNPETLVNCIRAAEASGLTPLVRVSENNAGDPNEEAQNESGIL